MISELLNIWLAFLAGLFAPLGAVCVLPLYPGFLAYLANQIKRPRSHDNHDHRVKHLDPTSFPAFSSLLIRMGLLVTTGIMVSLFTIGLIVTGLFESSLTNVIGILSPLAFALLSLISILMIFGINIGAYIPTQTAPVLRSPSWTAFLFGVFFGVIVLPCNPASLVILFALSTSVTSFFFNLLSFLAFGIGMALPLLLFTIISSTSTKRIISFFTKKHDLINRVAGVLMLLISLYYLFFVFRVLG